MVHIGNDWDELLSEEIQKEYYLKLYFYRPILTWNEQTQSPIKQWVLHIEAPTQASTQIKVWQ